MSEIAVGRSVRPGLTEYLSRNSAPHADGVPMLALDETLPPHESIGVNEVAVFLTIEGKLQGFVNSRNAVQIGSRRRVAQHCMSDVRVPAFIPSGCELS
jgi:hypothetical protein